MAPCPIDCLRTLDWRRSTTTSTATAPTSTTNEAIVVELGARSVLAVGCGTGVLACRLAGQGLEVIGVDPAAASLDVARAKPGAERVVWLHGDASDLPPLSVDVATMTGNVAQCS